MLSRRRAAASCADCRWCRLRPQQAPGPADFYCEARAVLIDRAELRLRCCDKFECWRSPPER